MIALIALELAEIDPTHSWRMLFWPAAILLGMAYLVRQIIRRRKKGASWNDAIAGGVKPLSGNVWIDGALFFVIVVTLLVLVPVAFYYL